jgi:hypothetical protein
MTTAQFLELINYYDIEPFGEYRQELRNGKLMALQANINRDPEKQLEPFKAIDFMDYIEKPPEKVYTVEELEIYAKQVFGG